MLQMRVCCFVIDLVFSTKAWVWLGRTSRKWPILYRHGCNVKP